MNKITLLDIVLLSRKMREPILTLTTEKQTNQLINSKLVIILKFETLLGHTFTPLNSPWLLFHSKAHSFTLLNTPWPYSFTPLNSPWPYFHPSKCPLAHSFTLLNTLWPYLYPSKFSLAIFLRFQTPLAILFSL